MNKKIQTRRCVAISGLFYEQFQSWCHAQAVSMAAAMEIAGRALIDGRVALDDYEISERTHAFTLLTSNQKRRSISASRKFHVEIKAWCREQGVSVAAAVELGARALMAGKVALDTDAIAERSNGLKPPEPEPVVLYVPTPRPRVIKLRPGFCGICCDSISNVTLREPLGRDDGMVAVCGTCASTPARGSRGRHVAECGGAR